MTVLWRLRAEIALLLVLMAVIVTYLNHFNNGFQFDDHHTVSENLFIRDLKFIPKYFTDSSTFSILPPNQSYRPIVTLSLAVDYWLGGGLVPFYFHITTFVTFLVQLVLMYLLMRRLFSLADDSNERRNEWLALIATAIYGLHPVCAETVNYIIQRADIQSTLGVVASMYLYVCMPASRRFAIYLIPAIIGMFAKPPAVMIVPILFVYDLLFEQSWEPRRVLSGENAKKLVRSLARCMPAMIVSVSFYLLQKKLSPNFSTGTGESFRYIITQPAIALRYFKSFFLPTDLSIDADFPLFSEIFEARTLIGFGFIVALLFIVLRSARSRREYPIALGVGWFLFALLPTSLIPLAEPMNDHRMFFPFVGLTMAVTWWIGRPVFRSPLRLRLGVLLCLAWLTLFAFWTRERNTIWGDSEALWREAAEKGPRNGRAQMNYGLALMTRGDYVGALNFYNRALQLNPNYHTLQINLGIVHSVLGNIEEGEKHFLRSIELRPDLAEPYLFYGRELVKRNKLNDVVALYEKGIGRGVKHQQLYHILLPIYLNRSQFDRAIEALRTMETIGVNKSELRFYEKLAVSRTPLAVSTGASDDSAGAWLNLSLALYNAGAYEQCIAAAEEAIARQSQLAAAYSNIAAASNNLGRWDDGIRFARKALEIQPDFAMAAGNLKYAETRRAASMSR